MLECIVAMVAANKPCAAICHGPWMLCSARAEVGGPPVIAGKRATCFSAIKDDVINAGAIYVDEPVVVDGPLITSRTPTDLTPFVHAIITAVMC
jgi:protease I